MCTFLCEHPPFRQTSLAKQCLVLRKLASEYFDFSLGCAVRARRLVGSLLAVALIASVGLVTGTAPRGGAQAKPGSVPAPGLPALPGVRPMAELPKGATPPPGPPDGVVGDRVDRASQASAKVEVLENSDPRVLSAITKAGNAPGPKVTNGPGEVAATPVIELPAGAPTAIDLVPSAIGAPVVVATPKAGEKDKPEDKPEAVEVPQPTPFDETKLGEKAKGKRKRFDEKSARIAKRGAAGSTYTNVDGSSSLIAGKGGSALDDKGGVADEDAALLKDGAGRVKRASGLVRASLPEVLTDETEVLSIGVKGSRIGLGVKRSESAKGKPSTATAKGSDVSFADVFGAKTELRYSVADAGVKEEIVLSVVPPEGEVLYRFPLTLEGFTARANPSGSISLLDADGKEQWVIPLALAWEQPKEKAQPTVYGKVAVTVEKNAAGGQDLVVRPDEKWLRDPARKYPVIIDPTITPGQNSGANAYGYVDSDYPTSHLVQCVVWGLACAATYSPTRSAFSYLRYDTTAVVGQVVNSASLKLSVSSCAGYPAAVSIRPLSSPFDASTITWPSRPVARAEVATVSVAAAGVQSVDVTAWAAKYASGEWPSYGFQVSTPGNCSIQVFGTNSSYLEVTYTAQGAGTNRPPTAPVIQAPLNNATVAAPVTLSATATDPDGDEIWYWFSACKVACVSTVQSGWTTSSSFALPGAVAGEQWYWYVYSYDGISSYIYTGPSYFTVAATSAGAAPQESWAWGTTPDYSQISTDNQPNAGVNTGTKRFVYSATDAQVAWSGPALALTRTYNSGDATIGAFGLGWSSILDARVDADASQNLTFRLPDGRREYHPFVGGIYRTQPGYWSTAGVDPNGGWTLLEKDGTTWRFRADGRLVSAMDRNGRTLLLQYNTANKVDQIRAAGYNTSRALSISWTGNQVTSVSDGTNAAWNYLYSGPFLSKVCDPRNNSTSTGLCTTYVNDGVGRIAQVLKPDGKRDVMIGYYPDGTVGNRQDAYNSTVWTYDYNPSTLVSTTTDPQGRVTAEQYNALGQIINRTEPGDWTIPTQTTTFTYDSNGYLAKKTSAVGSWQYVNDYRGNQVQVTDPTGATSFYSYNNRDQVVAYRDARSAGSTDNTYRWTYGYDANGNRVRETNPYGWSRTWSYQITSNTALPGTLTAETDWLGNVINYSYNGIGDVMSITYPGVAGDNVNYTYDALGRKASEYGRIVAPGITYTYDALNAPLTITEPPVTNLVNNVVHRRRITMVYNSNHLKQSELVEDIGGSGAPDAPRTTSYQYDQNDREISTVTPLGVMGTQRTFDAVGNVVTETDPNGNIIQTNYNVRNLVKSVTSMSYTDPSGQNAAHPRQLSSMTYDGAGRVINQTDGNYRVHVFTYDAMDRPLTKVLQTFTDRNGVTRSITEASYTYNQIGLKTLEKTGGNGLIHAYVYDQAGRLVQDNNQSQPRWDWFTLDRNGNVTSAQRVTTGNVVLSKKDTQYDARNRPTSITVDMGGTVPNRTTTYTYNKFGTVAKETDPLGAETYFWYDELGRVSYVVAPAASHEDVGGAPTTSSAAITKGYDTFGNVTHERDARGSISSSSYDKNDRRTRVDHPTCTSGCQSSSAYETWSYDQNGNVSQYRDRRGQLTDYTYDSLNRNVQTFMPDPGTGNRPVKMQKFDFAGNLLNSWDPAHNRYYTYNELNLVKTDGLNGTFDYNDLGQAAWTQDPNGNASNHEYLQTGERTKTTDPIGAVVTAEFDGLGRQTKETDQLGRVETIEYNRASEVTATKRWVSGGVYSAETATYDVAGNLKSTTNPVGVVTQYNYDPMRRLSSTVLPVGGLNITSSYAYDRASNITRTTNGNNAVTTYTYNQWNLKTSTVEPSTPSYPALADRTYTTTYDTGGLPVGESQPGIAVTRTFDPYGHPAAATWSGAGQATVQKTYEFDIAGRMKQVTEGQHSTQFSYTQRDQVWSSQTAINGYPSYYTGNQFDLNGNMVSRNQSNYWGNGTNTTFSYNSRNELIQAQPDFGTTLSIQYDLSGRPNWKYEGYGLVHTYQYDGVGRMTSDAMTQWGSPAGSLTYAYNADDNIQQKTVSIAGNPASGTSTYTYDTADRLKTWSSPAGSATYSYDNAGNRTGAGSETFAYDARNRLTSSTGATYSWAARGTPVSQTVNGQTTTYTTDAADRIATVGAPGGSVSYLFDPLDRVRRRSLNNADPIVSWYAGFDKGAFEEKNSSWTELKQYARLPDGSVFYNNQNNGASGYGAVVKDLHGDAIGWAQNGWSSSKLFDPFGKVMGTSLLPSPPIGYQSDYTDPTTGDVNMGARWYNPSTATFRSRDTYMGTLETPFSLNRYTYGLNNPLRYSDPTGHYAEHAGCYRDDRSYDWDCDHAANNAGQGVETDHPLYENADGTTKTNTFDVVDIGNGDSQISITSSGGTTVSTSSATVRAGTHAPGVTEVSGNLSYTPRAATQEEQVILFKQGNRPNALADAAHDDRKAQTAAGHSTDSKVKSGSIHRMCPFCVIPIVWVVEATVAFGVTYVTTKAIQKACSGGGCSLSPTRVASVIVEGVAAPVVAGVNAMPITGPIGTRALSEATETGGEASELSRKAKNELGGLVDQADETAMDVLRSRGGGGKNVKGGGLQDSLGQETLGDLAEMAAKGDRAAKAWLKMIKQAGSQGKGGK